jgi:predicted  nucleic acid-binding Zn-ribbon protein
MKKRIFPFLIALSALSVSASAAFYSVFGLSKLFAGASYQVMVMATSLEFAKLVVASLLYQYWSTINKWLRLYLSLAVFVLILITSGGIYGFLSGAYQETATKSELLDKGLKVIELKQTRFEEEKTDLSIEKEQLNTSISDLRSSLSNPAQVQYIDKNSGQLITTTSSSTRKTLEKELEKAIIDRDKLNDKLGSIQDTLLKLDQEILNLEISNEDQRELGPLKYLSEVSGYPMSKVVNWFLLLIIFVFDPLAIAMVIAANFAFSQLIKKTKSEDSLNDEPNEKKLTEMVHKLSEEDKIDKDESTNLDFTPPYIDEEVIKELSTIVGKEEKLSQPIKPTEEDLKKLEETLDLYANKVVDEPKKVLKYSKRVGDEDKK